MKRQRIRKLFLLISFLLFPVTLFYFSPYLIILGGFTGIISGSFILFTALFLFSLVIGRAFCGWLCPAGGLQECCMLAVDKRITGRKINRIKYIIWAPWIGVIALSLIRAGGIHSVDFFYMTEHGISALSIEGMVTYYGILLLIALLALLLGRRGMCHSICWIAPFMVIGTTIKNKFGNPSLHLEAVPANCVNCGLCSKNCPMSLEVTQMVQDNQMKDTECILCGACADTCPKKAIRLTFSGGRKNYSARDIKSYPGIADK